MNKITVLVTTILLYSIFLSQNAHCLTVGTYSSPPFSMYEDGEDIGMSTEAVRDLLTKSGITDVKIESYPLARGLVELENGRIDIFYPYVEAHKANLEKVILIGPISKYRVGLFVRKDYSQNVSLDTMQNMTLGAERGSIADALLTSRNMHVETSTQELSCSRMTLANRVAACALGILPGMYVSAINNMYQNFKFVDTGVYADMFVALGPSVAESTTIAIKEAFAKLKKEDYFEEQQRDYENKFKIFIETLS